MTVRLQFCFPQSLNPRLDFWSYSIHHATELGSAGCGSDYPERILRNYLSGMWAILKALTPSNRTLLSNRDISKNIALRIRHVTIQNVRIIMYFCMWTTQTLPLIIT